MSGSGERGRSARGAGALARERAARLAAEHAGVLKDRFIAGLAHELRHPLMTMQMWVAVLRDDASPELRARALLAIEECVATQARLVGDLQEASRAIAGKLHVELRVLDLAIVLRDALAAAAPSARARRLALTAAVIEPVHVKADGVRIRQVVDNLLANAIKFTEPGGNVTIALRRGDETVTLSVADTGCGLAADELPHVFEPFRQVGEYRGGLGLGLAISRRLVALQGGALTVESAGRGRGATFALTLARARPRTAAALSPKVGEARLDGARILVVDDDARVRDALGHLLRRAGGGAGGAPAARAARAVLASTAIDAMLCDILMPDESGHTFVRALRAGGHALPSVAITGSAGAADRRAARASGFDAYIAKPVTAAQLVATLADVMQRATPARGTPRAPR